MTMLATVTTVEDVFATVRLLASTGLPLPQRMQATIAATDEEADQFLTAWQATLTAAGIEWKRDDCSLVNRLYIRFPGCEYLLRHLRMSSGRTPVTADAGRAA